MTTTKTPRTRKPKVQTVQNTEITVKEKQETVFDELEKAMPNNSQYDWSSNMNFDDAYGKNALYFEYGDSSVRRFSYDALRNIATHPIVAAIIQTRVNQIAEFATEVYDDGIGFEIQLKDKHRAPTDAEHQQILELTEFMKNCGTQQLDFELTFESFLRQIIRDSLIYDQCNFEVIRNKKGQIVAFTPVDASTIRRANLTPEEMKNGKSNPDGIKYIQTINHKIVAQYTSKDLCFGVRRPRTNLQSQKYGYPELEELYQILQNLFNAETYNSANFTNGISAAGLVAVSSKMNAKIFRAFRREFYQMLTGVNNAKRTPIIQLDPEQNEKIEAVNLGKTNSEMEYQEWVNYLIKITCAIFQIDAAEIGFIYGAEGQSSSVFGTDPAQRVLMGKEKGLRPLVRSIETWLNKWIINEINPQFEIKLIGLDTLSTKEKMMIKENQLKYMTLNEIRALDDLEPLSFGDGLYDQVKNIPIIPSIEPVEPATTQKSIEEEQIIWKAIGKMPPINEDFDENAGLFVCPQSVANEAQEALDAKEQYGDKVKGGLATGWTRANQLANKEKISYKTIRRMKAFFDRHDGNQKIAPEHKDFPWGDHGFTAWKIWGGDSGRQWAEDVIKYVEGKLADLEGDE
jgi:hypothetical protein